MPTHLLRRFVRVIFHAFRGICDDNNVMVRNVLDPSLDFNTLAGMKEHGEWSMGADLNPITFSHNTTDTLITAWRKSTAFNEDLLTTSPTFNHTQWPGVSMAV
jgi:hypothetical protein